MNKGPDFYFPAVVCSSKGRQSLSLLVSEPFADHAGPFFGRRVDELVHEAAFLAEVAGGVPPDAAISPKKGRGRIPRARLLCNFV